ncbi:hypothetical protein ES705_48107 [subsurface metagenome]
MNILLTLLLFNQGQLFGPEFFASKDFLALVIRFSFNLLVIGIIVRGLYYSVTRKKNYLFSFMLISTVVFFICFMLKSITEFSFAFALGLFAIFGIIRYRTNPIPIKEMTYLFVVIGISVINGLSSANISYPELVFTNTVTIIIVYFLERIWLQKNEFCKLINYEKIDLIKPDKRTELLKDIRERTGLDIYRVEIGQINFLRDTVRLKVYFSNDSRTEEDGTETISFIDNGD